MAESDITGDQVGPGSPSLVTVHADLHQGVGAEQHQHADHLLAWSATATVSLRAGSRDMLVPPTHGLWVPAGYPHTIKVSRPGRGYGVLLNADPCPISRAEPTGVRITPLIRELIIFLDRHPDPTGTRSAAMSLLLALLEPAPSTAFSVPLPEDPRTRSIADAFIANPADRRDLATWASDTNTSVRTLTRLFTRETGMTFAQWRTHVRIRAALAHLARGTSVGATARAVGYHKPGAFAETFRRITGHRPSAYHRIDRADPTGP